MLNYLMLKAKDYLTIFFLFAMHLKHKWSIDNFKLFVLMDILLLSIITPVLLSMLKGYYDPSLFRMALLYNIIISWTLIGMFILKADIKISRVIYEIEYAIRLLRFMLVGYKQANEEYKTFLGVYSIKSRSNIEVLYDLNVISNIFINIFKIYFANIERSNINSEPYLVDTKEMKNLYTSKEFNEFYTRIFFKSYSKSHKPYEYLVIYILDHVLTELYKKPWFVKYYDEFILFKFIEYMLNHLYTSITNYNLKYKISLT